jgi:hypothetical protein
MRSLDGSHAKLARANDQIKSLRAQLHAAMEPDGPALTTELVRDTYEGQPALTLRVTAMPIFSPGISVLIGEIVHDLRSALDNLAWAMIQPARPHARVAERVYFPLAKSSRSFWRGVNQQLPGTSAAQRSLVEQYQPYHRSPKGRAMRTLRTLSNTDKHRALVPALFFPLRFRFKVDFDEAKQIRHIIRLGPGQEMRRGTELLTWTFTQRPKNVHIEYTLVSSPGFHPTLIRPTPGNDLEDVSGTLTTVASVCGEILSRFGP